MVEAKRVSDIIPISHIDSWDKDKIILINAGTGKGKTTWIKDVLIEYAKDRNKSILFLVNRNALKKQTQKDIEKKEKNYLDNIKITSYQAITRLLLRNKRNPLQYKPLPYYDYIVCDETHYFFSDALFSNTTDLVWNWLINSSSIKILMTATAILPKKYITKELNRKIKEYPIPIDYNQFVKALYFYENDKAIEQILFNLPAEEKAIYFCGTTKAYKISKLLPDAKFYCSKNNDYYKHADIDTFNNIIEDSKFECQVLCTTSVLDNGVNFIDPAIKHIIIDYFDLDEIQQFIGRKRLIDDDDSIILYIKNRKNQNLNRILNDIKYKIEQAQFLKDNGDIEFTTKYYKRTINKSIDTIIENEQIHRKVNKMMYTKMQNDIEIIEKMLKRKKDSYKKAVIARLKYKNENVFDLDKELDDSILTAYLDKLIGMKLFKDDQKKFKEFLIINDDLFNPAKPNHKSLGLNLINGYFKENDLPYILESKKERIRQSENYNKRYWTIGKINFDAM